MAARLSTDLGLRSGRLTDLSTVLAGRRALLVTDDGVLAAWPGLFEGRATIVIGQGEEYKTLATLGKVLDAALAAGLTRSDVIVGVGGGLVCDVAALAASTWMRGCGLVLVPTSLLAMVDAALGGKTAVNHGGVKNLIGTFYPAQTVLLAPEALTTLPEPLLVEGLAEMIKHGVIADRELFDEIRLRLQDGVDALLPLVEQAVQIKAEVVLLDPHEHGPRMLLNLGHTLGHAVEAVTGLRHGRAVAVGIVAAARLSVRRGMLAEAELETLVATLCEAGLPTSLAEAEVTASPHALIDAMRHDKKNRGEIVNLVLLDRIGAARIVACEPSVLAELAELADALA